MNIPTNNFYAHIVKIQKLVNSNLVDFEAYEIIYDNIYFIEKKMLERDFSYIGLHIRYISEVTIALLKAYLARKKIAKFKSLRKLNFAALRDKTTSLENPGAMDQLIKLKEMGNKYSHTFTEKFTTQHTMTIMNEPRMKNLNFREVSQQLKMIVEVFNWLLDENIVYSESIYYETDMVTSRNENKYLFDFVGKGCNLCNHGKYKIEDRNTGEPGMPYGPYLVCDSCDALLSSSLKVKRKIENKVCPKCKSVIKEIYDYNTKNIFYACVKYEECGWEGKFNELENEYSEAKNDLLENDHSILESPAETTSERLGLNKEPISENEIWEIIDD